MERKAKAAQFTTANPILAVGERGIEIDTGRVKHGDGVTAWTSLTYEPIGPASTTNGNLPSWSGTVGAVLADSGIPAADVALSNLDASLSAGQWKGPTLNFTVSGSVAVEDLTEVVNSTGAKIAISDVSTNIPAIGICVATDSTTRTILLSGRYKFSATQGWAAGDVIYRDETTDGDMQNTEPGTTGQKIQRIGIALAADEILLNPSMDVATVA